MINETWKRWLAAGAAVAVLAVPLNALQGAEAQGDSRLFPETGKRVQGRFLQYWLANGGLAQQGYPISEEQQEVSPTDGKSYKVQYFERAVFEMHPENKQPFDVLLSLLGVFRYEQKYPAGAPDQQANKQPGSIAFPETGKRLGGAFLDYWQANGGVAQQGLPISDELIEVSGLDGKVYRVQYFERAVFELHPDNKPPYNVLLSQLGTFRLRDLQASSAGRVGPAGDMSIGRACHSSTLLPDGKVLIAGGMERDNAVVASAELFDPSTGRFSPVGDMTAERVCQSAVMLPGGKVLIVGGFGPSQLASAELYDPATARFTPTGSMKERRGGATATLLKNGKVLVAGGTGNESSWYASAELYDPATGTFTSTGNMTEPRAAHTATLLPDGRVLLTGGSGSRTDVLRSAELYDPATGKFTPTGSMTVVRHKHAAEALPSGKVLIAGGSDYRDWRGRYASAELYDPATGKFTATSSMASGRFKSRDAIVPLKDGRLLVAGGVRLVEVYDTRAGKFATASGEVDADRFYTAATTLLDGRVLITGGYDYDIVSGKKAWLYEAAR